MLKQTSTIFNPRHKMNGYSFIELIIYSTLVAMVVGEFLISTQLLTESSRKDKERHTVLENERFLSQKLDWLFYGVESNQVWIVGSTLYFRRPDGQYWAVYRLNNQLQLAQAVNSDSDPEPDSYSNGKSLTSNHVTVSSEQFAIESVNGQPSVHIQASLAGTNETKTFDKRIYVK